MCSIAINTSKKWTFYDNYFLLQNNILGGCKQTLNLGDIADKDFNNIFFLI